VSYSQEGEDLLLQRLFRGRRKGFYVDVGAHHPSRFSNTRVLYDLEWRGINVDPTPGSMKAFERLRGRDINVEVAISSSKDMVELQTFRHGALNTTDEDLTRQRIRSRADQALESVTVPAKRLDEVLSEHLPHPVPHIDLLNVDVEGSDLDVLKSNDWSRYRPTVIVTEAIGASLDDVASSPQIQYLTGLDYRVYSKLVHSVVLVDQDRDELLRPPT
jgi:FkbM family methyltransferase